MLDIRIAKPCDQTWTAMKGDDQVRHCLACRKDVYNISEMTEAEVEALIRRTEGRFCARIYRRTDGRILTADCPMGVARVRRKRTLAVTGAFAALAGVLAPALRPATTGAVKRVERTVASPEKQIGYTTGIVSRPVYRHEEATMGDVIVPERELGQVTVPMGAPVAPLTGPHQQSLDLERAELQSHRPLL